MANPEHLAKLREGIGTWNRWREECTGPTPKKRNTNVIKPDLGAGVGTTEDLLFADLSGADLRGTNLSRAQLIGALLIGANLRGSNLRGGRTSGERT
jgi:uncharacterized protein YjbI with pentapeptide repeats